jgi:HD-GYP domain-containing protein (c-di-GMP phosphodiesterase class II)
MNLAFHEVDGYVMILKTKFITIIALVITLSIGISTFIVLDVQGKKIIEHEIQDINTVSNIITGGIESSMEEGKSEDLQKILKNIGRDEHIKTLRIVSSDGNILKSKNQDEIGTKSKEHSSFKYPNENESVKPLVGENSITLFTPIYNKPRCYGCHSKNINLNGIIELTYDTSHEMTDIFSMKRFFLLTNVVTVFIVSFILSALFSKYIMSPLKGFMNAIRQIESGDWNAKVALSSKDELGMIGSSFNRMIQEVKKLYEKNLKKEKEISKVRLELEHKREFEELNSQLRFKVKEVETSNRAVLSLTKEVKFKNIELEKMVERLKKINDIGKVLSTIIETDELIRLIIKTTAELLHAEKGSIHLRKDEATRLTLQYQRGMGIENLTHLSLDFHPLYKKMIEEGTHVFIKNPVSEGPERRNASAIGVPLKMKGQIIGGMLLEEKLGGSQFTDDEMDLLTTLANQAMVAIENAWLYESVKSNYFGTIQALVNALEASDRYTRGHSERVRYLSMELAKYLGLDYKELEVLEHASILHDIGKIGIDSFILNKQGKLSSTEFSLIKAHPLIGDEILGPLGTLHSVRTTILQHHERYDGTGYPYGIAGEEISLKARILSVVDTFDAMMTDRPYRKALSIEMIKNEMRHNAGTQFDPLVAKAFLEMLEQRSHELLLTAGYNTA